MNTASGSPPAPHDPPAQLGHLGAERACLGTERACLGTKRAYLLAQVGAQLADVLPQ